MTLTRTLPGIAVALVMVMPGPHAAAQTTAESLRQLEGRIERDAEALARRLERQAEALADQRADRARAHELAHAAGVLAEGLAVELGALAGRVVEDLALQAPLFLQDGRGARGDGGPEYTETLSRTVRLGQTGTFELTNLAGDIRVTGGGGDQVVVEAVKRVRNRDEAQGRAQLAAIEVEFIEQAGRLEVRTEFPNDRRLSGEVDFTVGVPAGVSVRLRTVAGDVSLVNVEGVVYAESISGSVQATGLRRIDLLKSVSGDVSITNARLDETATASTISGNLMVTDLTGRALEFKSVSGNVRLEEVTGTRLTAESVNGNLTFEGALTRGGRYDFTTHSGNVRLALEGDAGFGVNASTFSGDIRSDYNLNLRGRGQGRGLGASMRGSFGDASAVLELRTFSGTISLEER
jgi:DUF4097 and DUF4098 domain-containing protein YvlB